MSKNSISKPKTVAIRRQDGEVIDALANANGEPVFDYYKPWGREEFYFLNVKTPDDDAVAVGIYLDRGMCEDAADILRETNCVPLDDISAFDYLYNNCKLDEVDEGEEDALKEIPAIQFINREYLG